MKIVVDGYLYIVVPDGLENEVLAFFSNIPQVSNVDNVYREYEIDKEKILRNFRGIAKKFIHTNNPEALAFFGHVVYELLDVKDTEGKDTFWIEG